jgi:hypothetical protein
MLSGTLPWYVARASGLVAWTMLAASVVWGLLMTSKLLRGRVKNSWLLDLHRWLGGLALVFTGVHVAAILGDSYVHFGLASVLVPLASHWHPLAVAWGVASLYLLVAVELTSLLKRQMQPTWWRRVHFLSFPLFIASTVHGLSAGTDGRKPIVMITAVLTAMAVGGLTALRLQAGSGPSRREPVSRGAPGGRASLGPSVPAAEPGQPPRSSVTRPKGTPRLVGAGVRGAQHLPEYAHGQ